METIVLYHGNHCSILGCYCKLCGVFNSAMFFFHLLFYSPMPITFAYYAEQVTYDPQL